ncbi:hypothetical protein [Vannielia litorea]|uniref:hypothetical protein n=1 Tax=Vannielia TaxID=2813041 RepID=UPI001C9781B9|nr:hypothetical protein [Vannielia litorea]MBY6046840.1 hypothetical protein [Vannielia litorea]MBY6074254.1 hypothetical protein [Vannielia litorea]
MIFALLLPRPARAEFTLIDSLGAWFFYTQRGVGASYAACQVVSCVDGTCGSGRGARTQFSLYDARDGRGIFPEFIAPRRVPPGGVARLSIGGQDFVMKNLFPSPQFYLQIEKVEDAKAVLDYLVALEKADGNGKFTVVDPYGSRFEFTARGVTGSLDRMIRRCTARN